jgi:hypothetical protein
VEGAQYSTVLNAWFGRRGRQYWLSTDCRVLWKRGAVLTQGLVEEGRSISSVLNSGFGGRGALY